MQFTNHEKCPEGCHKCCTNILPLTYQEVNRIKKFIKTRNIVPYNHNTIFSGYVDICPFVNQEGKCNIYEVRPHICDYYFCNPEYKKTTFDYTNKHIVNMLLTFDPAAYCPSPPNIEELDRLFQEKISKIH